MFKGVIVKIGLHLSISRGFDSVLKQAQGLGCEVVQIFVKNPRSWTNREYGPGDSESIKELIGFCPVFAHLSYLPNLARFASDDKHRGGLLDEAAICERLGIRSLVVHCGSDKAREGGMESVAKAVDTILDRYDLSILLENSAGQGHTLGATINELEKILNGISRQDRVSLCLDTSHLFQAGYDLRDQSVWKDLTDRIEERIGPGRIGLFHLNDSKTTLGSRIDRHWHIGQGRIGEEAFATILKDQKFAHLCGVMETPKMGTMDIQNMKTIRRLSTTLVPGSSS